MISSLGSYGGSNISQWQQKLFATADANGDSALSMDELLQSLKSSQSDSGSSDDVSALAEDLFSAMDTDQDGSVSQSEFAALTAKFDPTTAGSLLSAQEAPPPPPSAEDMMAETDANGDGSITKDELAAVLESKAQQSGRQGPSVDEMFSAMDADGDGSVTTDELSSFAANRPSGQPPQGGTAQAGGATQSSSTSQSTDPLDTNKDGVVSLAERMAGALNNTSSATTGNLSASTVSTLLNAINEVAA